MKKNYLFPLFVLGLFFVSCKKKPSVSSNNDPNTPNASSEVATPKFTSELGKNDPKTEVHLMFTDHSNFGSAGPASPAYKLEISEDGQKFTPLPSGNNKLSNPNSSTINYTAEQLINTVKEVLVTGLDFTKNYYFRLTATNANKATASYTNPEPINLKKADVSQQTNYQKEELGAPARPSWVDAYRHYPELNFFKNGRYLIVWRKDPGTPGPKGDYNPALKWELHKITFKSPDAMKADTKFGMPIDINDIQNTEVLVSKAADPAATADGKVVLPNNLLPANDRSTDASTSYAPLEIPIVKYTQTGYYPVNGTSMEAVVAYKIRLFRNVNEVDPHGKPITKEVYNDSQVIFVNWRDGRTKIAHQAATTGGGGDGGSASNAAIPDKLVSIEDVRKTLNLPAGAYFKSDWEARKVTGKTPIEELITKADFEALFPENIRKQGHDKDGTYYSWENLVEASRYFPKFLGEGSKEDRYRELAAILGNKSHETGDGWPALGEKRWSYGLYWIVELAALSSNVNPPNKEDLYKAYSSAYTQAGNSQYPAVNGKSYHGRGPVQLSWNYNYGQMSEVLWGNKNILLENPNLIARNGVLGWASAIWFWMEPQSQKPSAHDVMVGNVDLSEPYNAPTQRNDPNYGNRTHTDNSKGHKADGSSVSYKTLAVPPGLEVGFGLTINIINGGLESNVGNIDNRQARRIGYYARYLDYFGILKNGRDDGKNLPINPAVSNKNGVGGDPVAADAVEAMKGWKNWHYLPGDGLKGQGTDFPKDKIPSVLSSVYQGSLY